MKVVMGIPWYFPDSLGGVEVYVGALSEQLRHLGVTSTVAVPTANDQITYSSHKDIKVVRYPSHESKSSRQGILASSNADPFAKWLESERPAVYHQHDWTVDCGLTHLRAAKKIGLPTIITIHLPKLVCRLGTMMYENRSQCDGQILVDRCARCFLKARGLPTSLAKVLGETPPNVASGLAKLPLLGKIFSGQGTAADYAEGLRSVAELVDFIVVYSLWLKQALLANGVPAAKILYVRLGVDPDIVAPVVTNVTRPNNSVLRIGFLARANHAKGLHVIIPALLKLPKTVKFEFHGMIASERPASDSYIKGIQELIAGNPSFHLHIDQPRAAVQELFKKIDVLTVPSQWLETGPLVVLEAHAWKVPVVGSDLGGIAELVQHDIDGLLVPPADITAWTNVISKLATDPTLLPRLKNNIPQVRTIKDVAREMLDIYRTVAHAQS